MSSTTQLLLREVEEYCRHAGIAESTFGRQAVNDGKVCSRLRDGKNITLETAQRGRDYIHQQHPQDEDQPDKSPCRGSPGTSPVSQPRNEAMKRANRDPSIPL